MFARREASGGRDGDADAGPGQRQSSHPRHAATHALADCATAADTPSMSDIRGVKVCVCMCVFGGAV